MSSEFLMDESCFACGTRNDNGLKLDIAEQKDGVRAKINPPEWTQGYNRVVHGGIIATILDELAVWAAFKKGHKSVTAELSMRIRKAMRVDSTYTASARVVKTKHRLIEAESEIVDENGELIASAVVRLLKVV
ncbi:hypothetical protein AMJ83_01360 [candidate division WOR_3 bacterium SM23_42]|uniref:Thioesterase domain-containing protein n=1 Tax=candidate division WOR_3 bacterium SM23_42 TaxID=1703779 RepID=A0A0S8FWW8_UNCW3|nr:MAG: hypothetical protein AMJ83_01360 [candidate division WOR_3 bacterium SM23_42]